MSDSPGDRNTEQRDDPTEDEQRPKQSAGMWLLGCIGKALLVFVVVAVIVFGACLVMIS